ncbi:MAG TPA: hypothetical protein VGF45_17100, partial [Polyangia bacterium]
MNAAALVFLALTFGISDGGSDAGASDAAVGTAPDFRPSATAPVSAPAVVRVTGTVYARGTSDPVLGASIVVDAQAVGESDEA